MYKPHIKRIFSVFLAGCMLFSVTACGQDGTPYEPQQEEGSSVIIDNPSQNLPVTEPEEIEPLEQPQEEHEYPESDKMLSMGEGGSFVKMGTCAAFIPQSGGAALADLEKMEYRLISDKAASELFYDGNNIYYSSDNGIYRLSPEGESTVLSEDLTYCMRIDEQRIYYIKQTNPGTEAPEGELWAMDKDGQNAVIILPEEIKGRFAVRDSWVYYISAGDGNLYRNMLFGSGREKLADRPGDICTVTDHNLYYRDDTSGRILYRMDIRTKSFVSLGAYASMVQVGDMVYVMARQERKSGLENLFSLAEFSDENGEGRRILDFENVGDDTLVYYWDGHAYIRRERGGIYRIDIEDSEQTKTEVLPSGTVFADGMAYFASGSGFKVFDCTTSETFDSKEG